MNTTKELILIIAACLMLIVICRTFQRIKPRRNCSKTTPLLRQNDAAEYVSFNIKIAHVMIS